jgi:hypothetical protein
VGWGDMAGFLAGVKGPAEVCDRVFKVRLFSHVQ